MFWILERQAMVAKSRYRDVTPGYAPIEEPDYIRELWTRISGRDGYRADGSEAEDRRKHRV